jgi:hypothetical protein
MGAVVHPFVAMTLRHPARNGCHWAQCLERSGEKQLDARDALALEGAALIRLAYRFGAPGRANFQA